MTMFLIYPFSSNREYDSLNCLNLSILRWMSSITCLVRLLSGISDNSSSSILFTCASIEYIFSRRNLRYSLWSSSVPNTMLSAFIYRVLIASFNWTSGYNRRGIVITPRFYHYTILATDDDSGGSRYQCRFVAGFVVGVGADIHGVMYSFSSSTIISGWSINSIAVIGMCVNSLILKVYVNDLFARIHR
jgi:hypothetical protein